MDGHEPSIGLLCRKRSWIVLITLLCGSASLPLDAVGGQTPSAQQWIQQALSRSREHRSVRFSGSERNYHPFINITVRGTFSGTYSSGAVTHYRVQDESRVSETEIYTVGGRTFRREPH